MARVTFRLDGCPSAENVFLAGSFNNWNTNDIPLKKRKGGYWSVTLTLPPGSYEYRYMVDGNWVNDQNSKKVKNDWGSENSLIIVK